MKDIVNRVCNDWMMETEDGIINLCRYSAEQYFENGIWNIKLRDKFIIK